MIVAFVVLSAGCGIACWVALQFQSVRDLPKSGIIGASLFWLSVMGVMAIAGLVVVFTQHLPRLGNQIYHFEHGVVESDFWRAKTTLFRDLADCSWTLQEYSHNGATYFWVKILLYTRDGKRTNLDISVRPGSRRAAQAAAICRHAAAALNGRATGGGNLSRLK